MCLNFIDYVIESDYPTAELNLKKIKPDIYCKGSEYSKSEKDISKNILKEKNLLRKLMLKLDIHPVKSLVQVS